MSESASGGRERSPDFFVKYIFSFGRDLPEARDLPVAKNARGWPRMIGNDDIL